SSDYANWEARIHDAERLANEARAEVRTVCGKLETKFDALQNRITAKVDELKDSISTYKIKTLSTDKKERKELRIERWQLIVGIFGILVYGAVMPSILNWERV